MCIRDRSIPGKLVGESDTRLWRMIFKHVEGAYAEADFSNVCCVGVDELNIRKGQEYVSVFADLLGKRVMFATEGRDKIHLGALRRSAGSAQWPSACDHAGQHGHEPSVSE